MIGVLTVLVRGADLTQELLYFGTGGDQPASESSASPVSFVFFDRPSDPGGAHRVHDEVCSLVLPLIVLYLSRPPRHAGQRAEPAHEQWLADAARDCVHAVQVHFWRHQMGVTSAGFSSVSSLATCRLPASLS